MFIRFNKTHIVHLRNLIICRHAGLHPGVYFADLEFPKAAYFRSGHISFFYPGEYRITADAEVFANFFH